MIHLFTFLSFPHSRKASASYVQIIDSFLPVYLDLLPTDQCLSPTACIGGDVLLGAAEQYPFSSR